MKKIGLLIAAGILPLLAMALFMKFISLHLSYSFLFGLIVLFGVAWWQQSNPVNGWVRVVVLSLPTILGYYFLIIGQLPGLWIALPFFMLAVIAGLTAKSQPVAFLSGAGVMTAGALVAFLLFPAIISDNLSEQLDEPAPSFALEDIRNERTVDNDALAGRVVVLDFFGTWCAPCIAEMAELKKIKASLAEYGDQIEFTVVCTDTGGDTPEKAKEFYKRHELPFSLWYDHESTVHRSFGFTGVPALVILGKEGNIRFKHEGYNQAEDLEGNLVPFIRGLLEE